MLGLLSGAALIGGAACMARLPLNLKNIMVVISNEAAPSHVLTLHRRDASSPVGRAMALQRLSAAKLDTQTFIINATGEGLALRHGLTQRWYPVANTIRMGPFDVSAGKEQIYLMLEEQKYRHTFRLIANGLCLSLDKDYTEEDSFVPVFRTCKWNKPDQRWGVFTMEKARTILGLKNDYSDFEEQTILSLVDELDRVGGDALEYDPE